MLGMLCRAAPVQPCPSHGSARSSLGTGGPHLRLNPAGHSCTTPNHSCGAGPALAAARWRLGVAVSPDACPQPGSNPPVTVRLRRFCRRLFQRQLAPSSTGCRRPGCRCVCETCVVSRAVCICKLHLECPAQQERLARGGIQPAAPFASQHAVVSQRPATCITRLTVYAPPMSRRLVKYSAKQHQVGRLKHVAACLSSSCGAWDPTSP